MRASVGLAMALIVATAGVYAFSPRHMPPLAETRIPVDKMHLNAVQKIPAGLLVAGELGHIMISTDDGASWRRAALSDDRQALITRLVFDDGTGLALGHEGWILRSSDGGESWSEVHFDEQRGDPLMGAARLPNGDWMAVGAFGRILRSSDDGLNWERVEPVGFLDWHLNDIVSSADGQQWLIVGEAGTLLVSSDAAQSWQSLEPFYNGSFYGALALGGDRWLIHGMRGNAYLSEDNGHNWTPVDVPVPVSLYAAGQRDNGPLLLIGQGGMVLSSDDGGSHFDIAARAGRQSLTAMLPDGDDGWLLASQSGLQRYRPTR